MKRNKIYVKVTIIAITFLFCMTASGCGFLSRMTYEKSYEGDKFKESDDPISNFVNYYFPKRGEASDLEISGIRIRHAADNKFVDHKTDLVTSTEYIIEVLFTDEGRDVEDLDFSVSGGTIKHVSFNTAIWTTPDTVGTYSISVEAKDGKGGVDSYEHSNDVVLPVEPVTLSLQPINWGHFIQNEFWNGAPFVGDTASNETVGCWFGFSTTGLSGVQIQDAHLELYLKYSIGDPLFLGYGKFNIAIDDKKILGPDRITDNGIEYSFDIDQFIYKGEISFPIEVLIEQMQKNFDDELDELYLRIYNNIYSNNNNKTDGISFNVKLGINYTMQGSLSEFNIPTQTENVPIGIIGVYLEQDPETMETTVIMVFDGYPAKDVGIQEGDKIIKVGGIDVRDMDIDITQKFIMGPVDTPVKLTVDRSGQTLVFECNRQELEEVVEEEPIEEEPTEEQPEEEPPEEEEEDEEVILCPCGSGEPIDECDCDD